VNAIAADAVPRSAAWPSATSQPPAWSRAGRRSAGAEAGGRLVLLALLAGSGANALTAGEARTASAGTAVPFLSASFVLDPDGRFDEKTRTITGSDVAARGIAVRLAPGWTAGVVFDADTLRMAAAWSGGALRFQGPPFEGVNGNRPQLGVKPVVTVDQGPGWADSAGSFKDPRADSIAPQPPPGPIPPDWGRYRGLHLHGDRVIFAYTVHGCAVLESPGWADGVFSRAFTLGASARPLSVLVATATDLAVAVSGLAGAKVETTAAGLVLRIPALAAATSGTLFVAAASAKDAVTVAAAAGRAEDLAVLTMGGPGRWTTPVETVGVLGGDAAPYVVDRITLPSSNPYGASLRVGSVDLFKNGTAAALGTWNGDVWVVTGIDATLSKLTWRRFATGLDQALGLKIVDDVIYVLGRDQITRLHDRDRDGEADFYECFNHDWELTVGFSFCLDLHTDPAGNFLFAFGAPVGGGGKGFSTLTRQHGCILRVSKDGSRLDVLATGLRVPNGMSVSPDGVVTCGDNQGTWVPASPLHVIAPGSFNGVVPTAQGVATHPPKALCYLPQDVDSSSGGQVWVTSDQWGPFSGDLLHMSYGTSTLFKVMKEEIAGQWQGGMVAFPLKLTSSAMRARIGPRDGQLYIAGLSGWQSNATRDGGFDRVRFTGQPVRMPTRLAAKTGVYEITYTCDLDPTSVADVANYMVEAWNYQWTSAYGSPQISPSGKGGNDGQEGKPGKGAKNVRDVWAVSAATLRPDRRTIALHIPELAPVWNVKVTTKVQSADRQPLSHVIHATIHNLGN